MAQFSERYINGIQPDTSKDLWESDDKISSGPFRLQIRVRPNGMKLWYVRIRTGGQDKKLPLGTYLRPDHPSHMTLAMARLEAFRLVDELTRSTPVQPQQTTQPSMPTSQAAAGPEAWIAPSVAMGREEMPSRVRSVGAPMTLAQVAENYAATLDAQGSAKSAGQVRTAFKLGVQVPFPEVAARVASTLTSNEATNLVRQIMARGRSKSAAGRFRSVMKTAFTVAMGADNNPNVPISKCSGVDSNPFANMKAVKGANGARKRALSADELGALMRGLASWPDGPAKAGIEMVIRMGGQRSAQLLRLQRCDVNLVEEFVVLYDPKGPREAPRRHVVPIMAQAMPTLLRLIETAKILNSRFIFTSSGATSLDPQTVTDAFAKLTAKLRQEDERVGKFNLSDIRRTVETWLSPEERNVSRVVRGHLQSHGISGVQQTHYDMYEYFEEKCKALTLWNNHLDALMARAPGTVIEGPSVAPSRMPETIEVNLDIYKTYVLPRLLAEKSLG